MSEELLNIEIDGQALKARKGAMIIEVADGAGITIPRFCYHRKLSIAANCRMCLVEVEKAPKPLPACATPVTEGMKVRTRSGLARQAQRSVMEFLLINHPLDCPICDQGGECELQDLSLGYGKGLSRFAERKRVVEDKDIGPLIATEMTRCIHCTRCVRFGEEIAGLPELGATGRGEHMEIGTFVERSVTSELSGNVIDLCPVGALTSKPFRFRARAWEMQQRPAIAPHDAVGSNLDVHVGRGRVLRAVPRENEEVNEVWISDRDRFGCEGMYAPDRLLSPRVREADGWRDVAWEEALERVVDGLRAAGEHAAIGALAGPSATCEEYYLLQKLVRALGSNHLDHRLRQLDLRDQDGAPAFPGFGTSLAEVERCDCVVLIGANPRKDLPLFNHRLRKAALRGARIIAVNPMHREFNYPLAAEVDVHPAKLAAALRDLLGALAQAKGVADESLPALAGGAAPGERERTVAGWLADAERALVVCGTGVVVHPQGATLRALAAELARMSGARLGQLADGANAAGAALAGMLPHRGVGGSALADAPGMTAREMLGGRSPEAMLLLGTEPECDAVEGCDARTALEKCGFVVALTAFDTDAIRGYAQVMLPIAPFFETDGTYVNGEGRWQTARAAIGAPGAARPAWKILRALGSLLELEGFEQISSDEVLAELREAIEAADVPVRNTWSAPPEECAPGSGVWRLAEPAPYGVDAIVRRAVPLQRSVDARSAVASVNPEFGARLGIAEGEAVRVCAGGGELTTTLRFDPAIPDECLYLPGGTAESAHLGAALGPVEIEKAPVAAAAEAGS